ncbi:kinesin-like protein KIN-14B, partial [Tanacetum coccineum]
MDENVKHRTKTPLFEDEGLSVVEFPDDFTIRVNTGDDTLSNPKKDYEFDRVYGPHIGQADVFTDVQPFVQSALDGHNYFKMDMRIVMAVNLFKPSTPSFDKMHGECILSELISRDKLKDLIFFVTIVELYNEQ